MWEIRGLKSSAGGAGGTGEPSDPAEDHGPPPGTGAKPGERMWRSSRLRVSRLTPLPGAGGGVRISEEGAGWPLSICFWMGASDHFASRS